MNLNLVERKITESHPRSIERNLDVLLVEDNESDAELVKKLLSNYFGSINFRRVQTKDALEIQLINKKPDIILSDFSMPGFSGLEALMMRNELCSETPFIFLSGTIGEDRAVKALKQGASDFILKDRLGRLEHAMRTSLERVKSAHKNNVLYQKTNEIRDSIKRARTIQEAFTHSLSSNSLKVHDVFCHHLPKDILSGDFHWSYHCEKTKSTYIAIGDCTGHGVPGSLMTMLSTQLLERFVTNSNIRQNPSSILQKVDASIVEFLQQKRPDNKLNDGMEIVLIRIDLDIRQIVCSGAGRSLYHLNRSEELTKHSFSKSCVGGFIPNVDKLFDDITLKYYDGDQMYVFTDGFEDQFGGPMNKKYSKRRLINKLENIQNYSFSQHRNLLIEEYYSWKESNDQIDDVLIFGMKL